MHYVIVEQSNMSLRERFEWKLTKWSRRIETIQDLTSTVQKYLSQDLTVEQNHEIQEMFDELERIFAFFRKEADSPELILATTGTTSSGNSTLANFLVGERIL
ncbi:MAG: hypothetical protein J6P29_04035, partial [Acetobacter sp.]|nr:hypothetical protein [Acetobacter sp.]